MALPISLTWELAYDSSAEDNAWSEGADLNETDCNGATALFAGVYNGNTEICKTLLEAGADPNIGPANLDDYPIRRLESNTKGVKPIHIAVLVENDLISLLAKHGACLDAKVPGLNPYLEIYLICTWATPLLLAANDSSVETLKCLIKAGARLTDKDCMYALCYTIATYIHFRGEKKKEEDILAKVEFLLNSKCLAGSDEDMILPFSLALIKNLYLVVNLFRRHGFRQCSFGYITALKFKAFVTGSSEEMIVAIKQAQNPQLQIDSEGRSLLHAAAIYGATDIVTLLIEKFDLKVESREWIYGATPYHLAALKGHSETVAELLRLGANPGAKTKYGAITPALKSSFLDFENKFEELKRAFYIAYRDAWKCREFEYDVVPIIEDIDALTSQFRASFAGIKYCYTTNK